MKLVMVKSSHLAAFCCNCTRLAISERCFENSILLSLLISSCARESGCSANADLQCNGRHGCSGNMWAYIKELLLAGYAQMLQDSLYTCSKTFQPCQHRSHPQQVLETVSDKLQAFSLLMGLDADHLLVC